MWVNEGVRASQEENVHPASRMLFRFWESLRGGRSAPNRKDLDLRQIRKLVPQLFIAEQDQRAPDFRWRLAGTAICGLFARELTGADVLDGWDEPQAGVMRRYLCGVTGTHRPALLRLSLTTDQGQSIAAEMAAFPLLAADGASTHVLGGLFSFPDPKIKHYASLTGIQLLSARFAANETLAALPEEAPAQARRKFRVIDGGIDHC